MTELPQKRNGKFYVVVLRDETFSFGRVATKGALGGKFSLPLPDLGDTCVCCDQPSGGNRQSLGIATDRFQADPVPTPVCSSCTEHALGNISKEGFIGAMICVGIGGSLWGFTQELWLIGAGGLALLAACILWIMAINRKRIERHHGGHHPGFQMLIAPGQCVVRTTNRRLASDVATRHRNWLTRIR